MTMDTSAAKCTEELDAQLVSTLREIDPHNYAYLFKRCKSCKVNARHLRFFKKDHIPELIPKSELGILAEFEYLLNLWQISKGYTSLNTKMQLNRANESKNLISPKDKPQAQSNLIIAKEKPHILSNNQPVVVAKQAIDIKPLPKNLQGRQISSLAMVVDEPDELLTVLDSNKNSKISNAKRMKFDEDDEEKFTLEKIIPELLKELKDSYELKDCLGTNERRLLCSSIVDYFESRNFNFSLDTMDELAEQIVEHFPKEHKKAWFNREGHNTRGCFYFRLHNSRRNMAKQTNNLFTSKVVTNPTSSEDENSKISNAKRMNFDEDDDDEEEFTLEKIVPELLKMLKDSYESKNLLSGKERRILCNSIVDYFQSRKINFSLDIMDELADQIVEHFPKEHKKSWCNRDVADPRGRFQYRLTYSRKIKANKTNNTFTSKVVTNSTLREPESREEVHDEDSKSIQAWLKSHKCENFSEIIDLWEDTMKYRCWQTKHLKDIETIREFLNNWPSYKLETGHELLTMDFKYFYPQAMETFRTRWLVYKENIEQFLEVELKDVDCKKLLEKYQLQKATTNEDSSSCILIHLVHAITKPLRHFETVNGNVGYAITDSQQSMTRLIQHKTKLDEYAEPHPCIFVVGDSLLEVQECYVVFMDLHYKLSYENCLALCVQFFAVLKVKYPQASQCFWEFIRRYMFNVAKHEEKFNEGTKNMINYLETVANSI